MLSTKRIQKLVNEDSMAYYQFPSGNIAYADFDWELGYSISFHQDAMPAYKTLDFDSLEGLTAKMKELSGDLRTWRKVMREE